MRHSLVTAVLAIVGLAACSPSSPPPSASPARRAPVEAPPAKPEPAPAKPEPTDTAVLQGPDDAKEAPAAAALAWTIETLPARVKVSKRDKLEIRITVANVGDDVANPHATPLHFTVDGKPSTTLSMAFGNGGLAGEWTALPPGDTADTSRVGVDFSNTVGEHVIAISDGTTELARTTVELTR